MYTARPSDRPELPEEIVPPDPVQSGAHECGKLRHIPLLRRYRCNRIDPLPPWREKVETLHDLIERIVSIGYQIHLVCRDNRIDIEIGQKFKQFDINRYLAPF